MPKFIVMCLKDAFVEYTTEVEADTPEKAHAIASSWRYDGEWERGDVREFDHNEYPEDEVELLEEKDA